MVGLGIYFILLIGNIAILAVADLCRVLKDNTQISMWRVLHTCCVRLGLGQDSIRALWDPIPKLPMTILGPEQRAMSGIRKASRSFVRMVKLEFDELRNQSR